MKPLIGAVVAVLLVLTPAALAAEPAQGSLFGDRSSYLLGTNFERAVTIGDVTGDGRPDIVAGYGSHVGSSAIAVLPQLPDGGFGTPIEYPVSGAGASSLATIDLDGSGTAHLVVASREQIEIFGPDGDGGLVPVETVPLDRANEVRVGDVTGNDQDDIVVVGWNEGTLHVISPDGQGGLLAPVTYAVEANGWNDLAIADVNGNGRNDVVVTSGQGHWFVKFSVLEQREDGTLAPATAYSFPEETDRSANAVAVGDVTGDGEAEIVVAFGGNRPDSRLAVFTRDSEEGFVLAGIVATYDIPQSVHIADVTGDGIGDVLVAHSGWNSLSVHRGQPGELPGPMERYSPFISGSISPSGFAIGDLDDNGTVDAVAIGAAGRGIGILRGTVASSPPPPPPPPPAEPDVAVTLDLDPSDGQIRRNQWLWAVVTVANNGDAHALGHLAITTPEFLTPHHQTSSEACGFAPTRATCSVDLAPGAAHTFAVRYRTSVGSGDIVATATVDGETSLDDNTAEAPVTVTAR